ncbi:MAG: RNA 2',3'-cyclic phosphodiesterase [Myxococcota bacterium]
MGTRLFVAVDVPDTVRERLEALRAELRGARWVSPDKYHLTLRFIGDADDDGFERIRAALRGVRREPFVLHPKGIGHFPPRGRPKVLWVGVDDQPELEGLQRDVDDAVAAAGFGRDDKRFHPHLTLARLKGTTSARVAHYEEAHAHFATEPFTVTEFHLYSSVLRSEGALHTIEETYPLAV